VASNRYTLYSERHWRKEIIMETLPIVVTLFIVFDIVSFRWGYDSREKFDSPEWERRATWGVLAGDNIFRYEKP